MTGPSVLLEDAVEMLLDHRGKTPKKLGTDWADAGVQVVSAKLISDGRLNLDRERRYVDEATYARWMPVKLRRGDVLLTSEAPLGEAAMVDTDAPLVLGQRLFALRARPGVADTRYLYYLFRSPVGRDLLAQRGSGTTVVGIRQSELRKVPLPLPSVKIQGRTADVLGSLDELIKNNRRRIELLEQMAQAIYREWFVHFRYPGHEDDDLVDSDLGPIPAGWEAARAHQLVAAGVLEIGDGYRAKNAEMTDSGLPFVRVASVRDGRLDLTDCDHLPLSYAARLKGKASQPADTVICMKGTVGRSAFVHAELPKLAYSPQVSYWRSLDHDVIAPSYVYSWIRSDDFRRQCGAVKGATDMADYVNLRDQRLMQLLRPSAAIMSAFNGCAEPTIRLAGTLLSQVERLAATRDLLLPKLVTGEIDVSELDLDTLVEAASA